MIDEIELHMHPMWQRRVLGVLRKVFPNIQFIITTHSPQVLGEADDSYKVLRLCMSENNRVDISEEYIYGKDSNGILKTIMNTSERSETVQKMFDEFYNFLDTENYKEAEEKLESIEEVVADNDPEVVACWVKLDLEQI
jgi:predicted ATP-binding protein involved in virulence